jgi:hypothetical protein
MTKQYRFFMYIDDQMVGQFLEQTEGGKYGEEHISRQHKTGGSLGGSLQAGLAGAHAGASRGASEDTDVVRRPTPASRFARLHDALSADEAIQALDVADDTIWDQIGIGEIVESGVTLEVPAIYRVLAMAGSLSSFLPMLEQLSTVVVSEGNEQAFDEQEMASIKQQLPVVEQAAAMADQSPLPLEAHLASDPRYSFFQQLKRDCMTVPIDELDGEARMLVKVQRKIVKGHPQSVQLLVPGAPATNRAERRKQDSHTDPDSAITLRYPAAVVTPLALWR